jgi:hypothetical protein
MIPEDALDQIQRWAGRRVPEHVRDQARLIEIDRNPTNIFWG